MACECAKPDTVALDEFLPYIMSQVMGLPAEIAAHNARLAAIELAKHTGLIKRTLFMPAQEGVEFYELEPPCDEVILSVSKVTVNGCCYTPHRELCACLPCKTYFYEKPNGLYVDPPGDDRPRGIEVRAIMVPDQDACAVDRCLYDAHAEVIADGAMARILAMPSAPWVDFGAARVFGRRFQQARGTVSKLAGKNSMSGPTVIKTRRFV